MRKLISVALCIMMVASLFCFGASAAEGTPINSAEDFAAMTADGTYYLNADITITTSYANDFVGKFDGNGHTVTVSAPMFIKVGGKAVIKNFTTVGEVTATGDVYAAAVSLEVAKDTAVTFENITNKAKITSEARAGGIVARVLADALATATTKTTFKYCTNLGDISGTNMVGGICAYSQGAHDTFIGCVNKGNVTCVGGLAGGILGRSAGDLGKKVGDTPADKEIGAKTFTTTITNCYNTGNVVATTYAGGVVGFMKATSSTITGSTNTGVVTCNPNDTTKKAIAGGIVAGSGEKNYLAPVTISKCTNFGTINADGGSNESVAGGLLGYVYGSGNYGVGSVEDSANYGAVKSVGFASHFFGYCNNLKLTIKNCVASAKIEALYKAVIGCSSAGVSGGEFSYAMNVSGIKLATGDATEYYSYAAAEANVGNKILLADFMANADHAGRVVYADVTVPNPPALPVAPSNPSTGDNFAIYAVVAIAAVLGVAYVSKKKVSE